MIRAVNWLQRHRWKVLSSLLVAAISLWLLRAGALPFLPDAAALERFQWWTFGFYLVLWSIVHWIRAWRWRYLLDPIHPVPRRHMMLASFIGFAAIVVLPARTGEMVRPALVREKDKLSGWSATGTVAAERIIDGLVLSLILLLGLSFSEQLNPLPERIGDLPISPRIVPSASWTALALFAVAFVLMGAFYWARAWTRRAVSAVFGLVHAGLADWVADRIERVCDGLKFLPRANATVPFIFWTLVYWLLNAVATLVLAHGAGLSQMSFAQACVLTGFLALGIMVPNAPGFFGQFQFSMYAALSLFVAERALLAEGSVLVFLLYVGQSLVMFVAALISAPLMHTSLNRALASPTSSPDPAWSEESPALRARKLAHQRRTQ